MYLNSDLMMPLLPVLITRGPCLFEIQVSVESLK